MNNYHHLSDTELTILLCNGNHAAFTEIYNRYWKKLFAIAMQKVNCLDDAEEIVQNIFVTLWNRKDTLAIQSSLSAYLCSSVTYRVIKNMEKKHHQEKYLSNLSTEMMLDNSTQDWLEYEELKERLAQLVSDLPEKCRLVYDLSRTKGLSQKQIAEELVISEKTVEAHLGKAIKKLRFGLSRLLSYLLLF